MKSDVDFTFGFRCWRVATGTPDLEAITANVSPACTLQNLGPRALGFFFVVVTAVFVAMCFRGVVGTETAGGELFPPASSPERTTTTAIVAARRNAAGAA